MPQQDDTPQPNHPPSSDDSVQQKKDLWAAAREIALARRGVPVQPPAPAPASPPPPPKKKLKVKLRTPPVTRADTSREPRSDAGEQPEVGETTEEPVLETELEEAPRIVVRPEPKSEEPQTQLVETASKKSEPEIKSPAKTDDKKTAEEPATEAKSEGRKEASEKPSLQVGNAAKDKDQETKESKPDATKDDEDKPPLTEEEQREARKKILKARLVALWVLVGGKSLSVSVGIHLGLLVIATLAYVTYNHEQRVDFLAGGGTRQGEDASQALENKVTRKRNQWLNRKVPMQKIAVQNAMSQIKLPDQDLDVQMPMSHDFLTGTKTAGGGFGDGRGLGALSGATFKPITLFGREIIGKKLAVILDISYSMTPYLQDVVKEVDRVAHGSPVVLFYGCGLEKPGFGIKIDERAFRSQDRGFEAYWRMWRDDPTKKKGPLPNADVYAAFARRNNTYCIPHNGSECAWTALTNDVIRSADALYWFSDFEDPVSDKYIRIVKENLDLRKQRLYIHPQKRGASFEKVRDMLAIPTGGDVVEPREKKE